MLASSTVVTRPPSRTTRPSTSTVSTPAPVSEYTRAARGGEIPHAAGVEPAAGLVREADRADHRRDPQRLEEVLVVGADGAVGAEPDRHAAVEQLAHGRDAAAQAQVAARVVGDGRAGVGEHPDVVAGEPHAVCADEAGPEQPVLGQPRDDALAETAPALDHLHLGPGQVRVHAPAVLAHQPGAAVGA